MFDKHVVIMFYINLGLTLFGLIQATAITGLCKKTAFKIEAGLLPIFMFFFAFVGFVCQLIMYSLGNPNTPYAVYADLAMLGAGYLFSGIYAAVLKKRSNRRRCTAAMFTAILPPIGTMFFVALSYRMRKDTHAQGLVFNGYAYTIAALDAFRSRNVVDYIDPAEVEEFERLSDKEAIRLIKKLKKEASDADGLFRYAEAVAYYTPMDMKIAVNAMSKAAKQGSAAAMFNLGYWYETGTYFKQDLKKSREFYEKARDLGDSDAEIRLAIVYIQTGHLNEGHEIFKKRCDSGDVCAKYDLALCVDHGTGTERDHKKALGIFYECAKDGLFAAQQRIFALASQSVNTVGYDDLFRNIAAMKFEGEFGKVMEGLVHIKEHRASDAAECFLDAVKFRGRWEGDARVFVGTLYMDCGKLDSDKRNGAAYVKSAFKQSSIAKELYFTLPRSLTGKKNKKQTPKPPRPPRSAGRHPRTLTMVSAPAPEGAKPDLSDKK